MNFFAQFLILALLGCCTLAAPTSQAGLSGPAPRYGAPPVSVQTVDAAPQGLSPTSVQPVLSEPSLVGVFSELPDSDASDYLSDDTLCQPAAVQTIYLTTTTTVPFRGDSLSTQVKVYPTTVYQTLIQQHTSTLVQPVTQTVYLPRFITESITRTEQTIYSLTTTKTALRYETVLQTAFITQTKSVLRTQFVTQTKEITSFITERETVYSTVTDLRTNIITRFAYPMTNMYGNAYTAVGSPAFSKAQGYY